MNLRGRTAASCALQYREENFTTYFFSTHFPSHRPKKWWRRGMPACHVVLEKHTTRQSQKKKKGLNYSFWRKSTFQTHQKWQNNKISSTTMTEARAEPQTSEGKVFKSRFPNETPYAQLPSLWQSCAEIISLHWKREMFKNFHKLLSLRNSHATMLL